MHTAPTKIRHYADGGLIAKIFGKPQTSTPTSTGSAPPVTASTVPLGSGGAEQARGAIKSRSQRLADMERSAVGMAKGGKVRNCATGGKIPGKSPSATADNIPIMATAGEYMIKKKAVDKIGVKVLDALNSVADTPAPKKAAKKKGGALRKMAGGGYLYNEYRGPDEMPSTGSSPAPAAAPAPAPAPLTGEAKARQTLTQVAGRAKSKRLAAVAEQAKLGPLANVGTTPGAAPPSNAIPFTLPPEPIQATTTPGAAPTAPAAQVAPTPAAPATPATPRAAPQSAVKYTGDPLYPNAQSSTRLPPTAETPPPPITGGPTMPGSTPAGPPRGTGFTVAEPPKAPGAMQRLAQVAKASGAPALMAAGMIPEQLDVASVAANPAASKVDVATQQAQGLGRFGSAAIGAGIGGTLGLAAGPAAPIVAPLAALAGGAYGYWAADKAMQGGRQAVGVDPRAPIDQLPAAPGVVPVAAAPAGAAYPETAGMHSVAPNASPAAVATAVANPVNPAGNVTRIGNSYSGAPGISGDITINGQAPRGGFVANAGDGPIARLGMNPSLGMALSDARDAAMARGDYDAVRRSYNGELEGGNDPVKQLMNNGRPMTARKASALAALKQTMLQEASAKAGKAKADQEAEGLQLDNQGKRQLAKLQNALTAAKTPEARAAAEENLRAFQGKYEKPIAPVRAFAVPGGQVSDPATGAVTTQPSRVYDPDTKTFIEPGQGAKTSAYTTGQVYKDAKGNQRKWDGSKFVPV